MNKIANEEMALGTLDTLGSPRLIEVLGIAGLDMVLIDMMFCPTDWETVASMARSARNFGMDTMVRVPGFPWLDRTDPGLAVDAVRALGVGATGVMASCATVEEVTQLVEVSKDWHRDIHLHPFGDDDFELYEANVVADCIVMPMIESKGAIDALDEIVAVPGLRAISLGMTDISRMLGHPFDYEHPDVEEFVGRTIALGNDHGVAIGANVGYKYSRSIEDIRQRIDRMTDKGFNFLWLQNDGFVIQWLYRSIIAAVRPDAAK